MCGIAGYKIMESVNVEVLDSMVNALYHRGPDSVGYYKTEGYQAGMRRLSINDIKTGDQPLYNEDKNVVRSLIETLRYNRLIVYPDVSFDYLFQAEARFSIYLIQNLILNCILFLV